MTRKIVIIYGPPGSGKGTQANLLAWAKGLIHFDTGKLVEAYVHSPANLKNKVARRERINFDTGKLMTPSFVLQFVKGQTRKIADSGYGIVYSASPRTLFEAFGNQKTSGLIGELETLFGRKNIHVVLLNARPTTSVARNSSRYICQVCRNPIIRSDTGLKQCPICLGPLRRRTLDKPEVIKIRLEEYRNRTEPILAKLEKRGYRIIAVDGERKPYQVHQDILRQLKI